MDRFGQSKVLLLQQLIIESSGGESGVRDLNLLDSALNSCYQTFDGKELYPTKEEKAARLGYGLMTNHSFVDGNKRVGALVMLSFLQFNGIIIKYKDEELVNLCLSVADDKEGYDEILAWINKHKI